MKIWTFLPVEYPGSRTTDPFGHPRDLWQCWYSGQRETNIDPWDFNSRCDGWSHGVIFNQAASF